MAEENKAKDPPQNPQQDLSESLLPSHLRGENWRGQVIDETAKSPLYKWVVGGSLAFSLIVFGAVYYKVIYKTPEEKLAELLINPSLLRAQLLQYQKIIKDITSSSREIREAVEGLVHLSKTQIRVETHPHRPYIEERHEALVTSLKGLVRLVIENMIDLKVERDFQFFEKNLNAIGEVGIEYYENSIIQSIPLLERSVELKRLERLNLQKDDNLEEIAEVRKKIEEIKEKESFSPLPALLLLGKWYRYHNKMTQAEECFDLARTYIEGYTIAENVFEGKKPEAIGPLWEEYVASVESLAEIYIVQNRYRIARAYLTRLLDTPKNIHRLFKPTLEDNAKNWNPKKISELKGDLQIIQRAIESPLSVSSFPSFDFSKGLIKWDQLQTLLIEKSPNDAPLVDYIKKRAPQNLIEDLEKLSLGDDEKRRTIHFLNELLMDPRIASHEFFDPHLFTPLGKELYKKSKHNSLNRYELQALNRDILETHLKEVFFNPYILSDGERLNALLNPEQTVFLLNFYKEAMDNREIPINEREYVADRIEKIQNREANPTISELNHILLIKRNKWQAKAKKAQADIDRAEVRIKQLNSDLLKLENEKNAPANEIASIQKLEKEARDLQVSAHYKLKKAKRNLDNTLVQFKKTTLGFSEFAKQRLKQIELLEFNQKEELSKTEKWETILLSQIDTQVELKEKYLFLLKQLKATGENKTLINLKQRYGEIQKDILKQKELLSNLSGNARETKKLRLELLQTHQYNLIKKIDEIFSPLQKIIDEIAEQESEVYKAENTLLKTREQIAELIGDKFTIGTLAEKAARRKQLLLSQANAVFENPALDQEIETLNKEISVDQAQLALLLEKESIAEQTLETFFPGALSNTELTIPDSTPFSQLKRYLNKQGDIIEKYETLNNIQKTSREIYHIYQNMGALLSKANTSLEDASLSESLTIELNRFILDLIENQKRLSLAKQKIEYLKANPKANTEHFFISNKGFYLDNLQRFELERKMGLQITEYLSLFDDRKNLIEEVRSALDKKEKLENLYTEAVSSRNQKDIDTLTPQLVDHENFIQDLSLREKGINGKLKIAQAEYQNNLIKIKKFQQSLKPQIEKNKEQIQLYSQALSKNDEVLFKLGESFISQNNTIEKTFSRLEIEDLKNLEALIESEEEKLARLKKIRTFKVNEQYFQARARWMIAQTYYSQARSSDLETLKDSDIITSQLLEKNKKYDHLAYAEFEEISNRIDTLFSEQSELDEHKALFANWVQFCENQAIQIFTQDLPNYFLTTDKAGFEVAKNIGEEKTNDMYLWRGKGLFETGKIHLLRAHRIFRSSRLPPTKTPAAIDELHQSTAYFLQFQDFASQNSSQLAGEKILYYKPTGSQEFPSRKKREVKLNDEANLFLGVAAQLSGNSVEAISHYREIIQGFIREAKNEANFVDEPFADPMIAGNYPFQSQVHPVYASLMSQNPIGHEALYRLGKCYKELAFEAKRRSKNPKIPLKSTPKEDLELFKQFSETSINYLTQLIYLQGQSPYRKAAQLLRSQVAQELGNFSQSRQDLIALATPMIEVSEDPFSQEALNIKGDYPGELNPPYHYVMFELGNLYSKSGLEKEAGHAFAQAMQGSRFNIHVFNSRLAYAKNLFHEGNYFMASFLLEKIINEKRLLERNLNILIPLDVFVDHGLSLVKQGNLLGGLESFQQILKFLPKEVLEDGELDLNRPEKLMLLSENFRDTIRPFARSLFETGKVYSQVKEFQKARKYFSLAKALTNVIPWKEDIEMQKLNQDDFRSFKHLMQMEIEWENIENDFYEISFAATSRFRESTQKMGDTVPIDSLLTEISETLKDLGENEPQFIGVLTQTNRFFEEHQKKLPEVIKKRNMEIAKQLDRNEGKQRIFEYDAFQNIKAFTQNFDDGSYVRFINLLLQEFPEETLEGKYLNDFALFLGKKIDFTDEDRRSFHPTKTNLENLLSYSKENPFLSKIRQELLFWLDDKIALTGLDISQIPVSKQSTLLEHAKLFKVSLLSILSRPQDIKEILETAKEQIALLNEKPGRVTRPDYVWEILDIASMVAFENESWDESIAFNEFLLNATWSVFELDAPTTETLKHTLFLAESLVKKSQIIMNEMIFYPDIEEQKKAEKFANNFLEQAKGLLKNLESNQDEGVLAIASRVRARKLLEEIGG